MLSLSAFTTTVVPSAFVAVITPVEAADDPMEQTIIMTAEHVIPFSMDNLFIVFWYLIETLQK